MIDIIMAPHLMTAIAYYIIGFLLIVVSVKVLSTHPVNRAFLFGDYLTPEGVKQVMRHWPLVSLFGIFIFSCGIEHHLDWRVHHDHPELASWLLFMGWEEAAISMITAVILCIIAVSALVKRVRLWRK